LKDFLLRRLLSTLPASPFHFDQFAYWLAWCLPITLLLSRTTADLSLVIVDMLFLWRCYLYQSWDWLRTPWVKWFMLFFAYLLLINVPNSLAIWDSFSYALFFTRWPLFAIALSTWLLTNKINQRHFLITLGLVICFICFDTWFQYIVGHDIFGYTPMIGESDFKRLSGPYSKPLVGIMLLRSLFLGLFAHLVFTSLASNRRNFLFSLIILVVGILTILISGERMALILCIAGFCVVMFGFWLVLTKLRLTILLTFTLLVALLAYMAATQPALSDRMLHNLIEKLAHFSNSDYGLVFNGAWRAWQENFFIGGGLHTYRQHCMTLFPTDFNCTHAHNLYLQLGSETGLIGISLFSVMIVTIYIAAIKPHCKQKNWLLATLSFSILSFSFWPLIGGISLLSNWVAALTWLGVGWVLTIAQQSTEQSNT
jgi:O-antigen ligase